jgi:hypothetical protein
MLYVNITETQLSPNNRNTSKSDPRHKPRFANSHGHNAGRSQMIKDIAMATNTVTKRHNCD